MALESIIKCYIGCFSEKVKSTDNKGNRRCCTAWFNLHKSLFTTERNPKNTHRPKTCKQLKWRWDYWIVESKYSATKSPQSLHELCDTPRGYEFIDLTNQIPPPRDLVETLEYDDKEDTIEWNEGDELGQTDEDHAVVIPWNLNENVILVMWSFLTDQMSWYRCEAVNGNYKIINNKTDITC